MRIGNVCLAVAFLTTSFALEASTRPSFACADSAGSEGLITQRLHRFYSTRTNYRNVRKEVLRWHKTTKNGCVAFLSTALRQINVNVPLKQKINGYGVSRITFAFSTYLESKLGFRRIADAKKLRSGDIVFSTGYPDHVFVFDSWVNQKRSIARVIDNQGFRKKRALRASKGSGIAAFAYALRR